MNARYWLAYVTAGCSFHPVTVTTVDAFSCAAWTSTHFDACSIPVPMGGITLTSTQSPYTYDTTDGGGRLVDANGTALAITSIVYTQSGDVDAALWSVTALDVKSSVTLDVVGTKPLIVAAWTTIVVDGTIDASSHAAANIGAGANPAGCTSHAAGVGGDGPSGTGGGGGGGFGGSGAQGGGGDGNCMPMPPACDQPGGAGGGPIPPPSNVIGGCDGGASGSSGEVSALGGAGGGAILLAAAGSISIAGTLLAGGAGGAADDSTTVSTGGGGGGAGGFLGLEAGSIDVSTSTIVANGGGGGGGADIADVGGTGGDGTAGVGAAAGGAMGSGGTVGGSGSSLSSPSGGQVIGTVPDGGGGGGGGGAGFVLYWAGSFASASATISPAAVAGP